MSDAAKANGTPRSIRNTGRANLEKARLFAAHVEDSQDDDELCDVEAAEAYLDAAIVFGKATQDWLADRYGRAWLKQSRLWNDPICKFFADVRDVVVHEDGSVQAISRTHVLVQTRRLETTHITRFHFIHDDPRIAEPSALWVVNGYLDLLESVLADMLDENHELQVAP